MKKRINLYLDSKTIERLRHISLAEFGRVTISRTIDFLMGVDHEHWFCKTDRAIHGCNRDEDRNEAKRIGHRSPGAVGPYLDEE